MAKNNNNNKNNNKSSNKGKSRNYRRPNNKGRGKSGATNREMEVNVEDAAFNKEDVPHVKTSSTKDNDPSWYTHIFPLASDVANFNFNIPVGTPFNPLSDVSKLKVNATTDYSINRTTTNGKVIPGIMTFNVSPSIGYSADPTSAPNIAAQQMYTIVRKANSGAVNYDKTDLMMTVVAMDNAYMLYEILLRAYRTIGKYDPNSRYMPDGLMYAQGFAPALQQDLANFRGVLDLFCYQLGSINIPDEFDFIKRHSWMFTNVYADASSSKAQLYMYRPNGLYVWSEGESSKPSYLKWVSWAKLFGTGEPVSTIAEIQHAIDMVMQPILGSADIGTISGDIAKAFNESGMIQFQPVSQYEALQPVYSMEVIQQMMNSYIIGVGLYNGQNSDYNYNDIWVDNSNLTSGPFLVYTPKFEKSVFTAPHAFVKHLVNLKQDANVDINMVATRNIITVDWESDNSYGIITSCGTEVVTSATSYVYSTDGSHVITTKPLERVFHQVVVMPFDGIAAMAGVDPTTVTRVVDDLQSMIESSAFDNQPARYVFFSQDIAKDQNNTMKYQGIMTDTENYTWLEDQTIKQLNDAALLSLFYCKSYPNII